MPWLHCGLHVQDAGFSPDGRRIVSASLGGGVKIWSLPPPAPGPDTTDDTSPGRDFLALAPGALGVATRTRPDAVEWLDFTASPSRTRTVSAPEPVVAAGFSGNGQRLAVASANGEVRIWDAGADGSNPGSVVPTRTRPHQIQLSPDGRMLAVVEARNRPGEDPVHAVLLIGIHDGRRVLDSGPTGSAVESVHFNREGTRLLVAIQSGQARVWSTEDGSEIAPAIETGEECMTATWSPSGDAILTAQSDGGFRARAARLWSTSDHQPVGAGFRHEDGVLCAAFDPTGTRVATGGEDGRAWVWDRATGARLSRAMLHKTKVNRVEFSPDGRVLVTTTVDGRLRLWDPATGDPFLPAIPVAEGIAAIGFSTAEPVLVAVSPAGGMRRWTVVPAGSRPEPGGR
jgi:WD40 repeat protein